MNKFINSLTQSSTSIKEKRASILASSTKSAQEKIVNDLQDELNKIELEMENLTDIAPENTYDLKPGGSNFNPSNWANKLQELKVEKWQKTIEINIARETLNEWFGGEFEDLPQ